MLNPVTSAKLQKIMKKRLGKDLTQEELDKAYDSIMSFAFALIGLAEDDPMNEIPPCKRAKKCV